jgi:hypothetical protein
MARGEVKFKLHALAHPLSIVLTSIFNNETSFFLAAAAAAIFINI